MGKHAEDDLPPDVTFDLHLSVKGNVIRCGDHKLVKHRDGRPMWCNKCKRAADGRHKDEIEPFWKKRSSN